jgi:4-hydroxybutyrate CoA-transferase
MPTTASSLPWQHKFADRLVAPEQAVERVRSGDLVRLPMGPVPVTLVNALARRRSQLQGVCVWQGATRHPHAWSQGDASWNGDIQFVSDFLSPVLRPGVAARATDFAVTDYAVADRVRAPGRQNNFDADVFMALVSEPDADGFVTFGYSIWHSKALLRHARLGIAEVGKSIVRPCGDTRVHLSDFDLVVEQREEPNKVLVPELSPERIEVTEVIGAYISTLVNDGDTIQIGTGTLSSCMGGYLLEKNDLGVDAEILVSSVVELVKAGVATGKHKTYKPGLATASFIVPGSDFDYCDQNPKIELHDIQWCNNLPRICGIDRLVAINQASMIDLTGQVASESIGPVMFTGPGGQLAWTIGAVYASGGRAIHVLPSTARNGQVSRIVTSFEPGTIITVPRTFVDYVVTEYGIANLQGLTQRQRALALIDLAHPDFRDHLKSEAKRLFWP